MSITGSQSRDNIFPLLRSSFKPPLTIYSSSSEIKMDRPFNRLSARITDFLNRSKGSTPEIKNQKYFTFERSNSILSQNSNTMSMFSSTDSLNLISQNEMDEIPTKLSKNEEEENQQVKIEVLEKIQNLENDTKTKKLEVDRKRSISGADDSNSCSIFSMKDLMERKSQLEIDCIQRRIQARETFFADKILLLRKTLGKQCSEASQNANEQRQLASKLQHDLRSLTHELDQVNDALRREKTKNELIGDRIEKLTEECSKMEAFMTMKNLMVEQLTQEKFDIGQQTEFLRKELHRLKLDLHLKELKMNSLVTEITDGKTRQVEEIENIKTHFQTKLDNIEKDKLLITEELEEEQKSKRRLEENFAEVRQKQKQEIEQYKEELMILEESTQAKTKKLELQLAEVEAEKSELLKLKRELSLSLIELEVTTNSSLVTDTLTLERIQELEKELNIFQILLKDSELEVEAFKKTDSENKAVIRQLKTVLEVDESEKSQLRRLRAKAEEELQDALAHVQDITRRETETSGFNRKLGQDRVKLMAALDESKLEMENMLKGYNSTLLEMAAEKSNFADQVTFNKNLARDNDTLREQIAHLEKKVQVLEQTRAERENLAKKEHHLRLGEVKSKMKVDEIKHRRTEDALEKTKADLQLALEEIRKLSLEKKTAVRLLKMAEKQGRETSAQRHSLSYKVDEAKAKNAKMAKLCEISNKETNSLRDELRSAKLRVATIREAKLTTNENIIDKTSTGLVIKIN